MQTIQQQGLEDLKMELVLEVLEPETLNHKVEQEDHKQMIKVRMIRTVKMANSQKTKTARRRKSPLKS